MKASKKRKGSSPSAAADLSGADAKRKSAFPSPVVSSHNVSNQILVKVEPTTSSKPPTAAGSRPTPEECHLVVQELGKLHPDVIEMNNQRRQLFAQRGSQVKVKTEPGQNGKNVKREPQQDGKGKNAPITDAVISTMLSQNKQGGKGKNTPITDAVISTMLSQNTTAANQNKAFANLKKAYPGWESVANETNISRIEDAIRVAGLAQRRAERIQSMLQTIQTERGEATFEYLQHFQSNDTIIKELSRFKGMGPKTISCILLFALGRPDFPVDTHVLRISKQMGWIGDLSREAAYDCLNGIVPDEYKMDLHCLLVSHGKQCNKCAARGKAQFPPKEQWVCPMADIKRGKLSFATIAAVDEKKPVSVKKEEVEHNRLFRC